MIFKTKNDEVTFHFMNGKSLVVKHVMDWKFVGDGKLTGFNLTLAPHVSKQIVDQSVNLLNVNFVTLRTERSFFPEWLRGIFNPEWLRGIFNR